MLPNREQDDDISFVAPQVHTFSRPPDSRTDRLYNDRRRHRTTVHASLRQTRFRACIEQRQRCVVILSNDVRAEALFPEIVKIVLGETGMPWRWEYGASNPAKP
jgi:hypothetical protein